jgi:hypothetical protein
MKARHKAFHVQAKLVSYFPQIHLDLLVVYSQQLQEILMYLLLAFKKRPPIKTWRSCRYLDSDHCEMRFSGLRNYLGDKLNRQNEKLDSGSSYFSIWDRTEFHQFHWVLELQFRFRPAVLWSRSEISSLSAELEQFVSITLCHPKQRGNFFDRSILWSTAATIHQRNFKGYDFILLIQRHLS